MILGSLLLILVAVALLSLGLATGSSVLLTTSIGASLLAAIALLAYARQAVAARASRNRAGDEPDEWAGTAGAGSADPTGDQLTGRGARQGPGIPTQQTRTTIGSDDAGWRQPPGSSEPDSAPADPPEDGDALADEPPIQAVSPEDAARVAQLRTEVLVVDGRPRYHLASCPHLDGRETELLPVTEAVELGFTPCARCAPDTALLAQAHPV